MSAPTKSTFLWDNIIENDMISCDDTDSDYPCTNLVDENVSKISRTQDETGVKTWQIDLGSGNTTPYDTFGIAGHNFSPSGDAFQIGRGADYDDFSPALESVTMTKNHCIYYWSSSGTDRYIKFTTNEITGDNYHEIGEMWLGMRYECAFNPQIPMRIIRRSNETKLTTGGGQIWSYVNYKQCGYELKFIDDVTPVMYASLEEIFDDRGFGKPFFFNLAPTDSNDTVFFAHTEKFDFSIDKKDKRPGSWVIVEEK